MSSIKPEMINEFLAIVGEEISSSDAEKFLQGQLSCDVKEVNAQQSRLGAYCNHI